MFLKSGQAIAEKIRELIDGEITEPVRLAVAFWGNGADYKLQVNCKIICDLKSGACNPAVIRKLLKRDNCVVLRLSGLHAKVVISSAGAVVSSANMSTNGLGAEGSEASGTIEAGYFVSPKIDDYKKVVEWFENVWNQAIQITELDLVEAQTMWDFRNKKTKIALPEYSESITPNFDINPYILLQEFIDNNNRLRAVRVDVLTRFKISLPDVENRRLGKIGSWACHILLNRAGIFLDHSAGNGEEFGLATDQWIIGRFGKNKKNETMMNVMTLLRAISRDSFFSAEIRLAAIQVLSTAPWEKQEDLMSKEA